MGVVAVTGANGQVGTELLLRLKDTPANTVALIQEPADVAADRCVVGLLDSAEAQTEMRESDIIVHLAGTLRPSRGNSYIAANVRTTEAVARAVRAGKATRILYLSYVGASERAKNVYLRAKATSERMLQETGREVVVFRCTHIIGRPDAPGPTAAAMLAKVGRSVAVLGTGAQIVAPIYRGDVVSALESAMSFGRPGIYDLAGPDRMTMDELVQVLNRNPTIPITHLPGWCARILAHIVPSLPGPMVDVLLHDSLGDASRATQSFGVRCTPLRTMWA